MDRLTNPESQAETPKRRFFIKTFGCQMNVADTERMSALLSEQGLEPAVEASDADVILINGCTVREKAVHKAVSFLGHMRAFKQAAGARLQRGPIIGIGGCVGQIDQGKLFKRAPYLDFVFGTDTIDQLPGLIQRVDSGDRHFVSAEFDPKMSYSTETKVYGQKAQAFVNIMKGCDKYCSYCIVPFTRGKEKSRTIDEVVDDVARLIAQGVREVTLLGQNVNSFGKGNANTKSREPQELHNVIGKVGPRAGEENFPQLLRAIDQDPRCAALKRLRFTSSHPLDFSDELIECYNTPENGGVARLAAQLHLPVQSGSDRILQKMSRHHQIEGYIKQMDRLREINPDVGLSTDLIVGFPTETEEDFQATLDLLNRVQFDGIYAFAYSPRPGTKAAKFEDDVSKEDKNERLNRLLKHQVQVSAKRYQSRIGLTMEVLVEGPAKNQGMNEDESIVVERADQNAVQNTEQHNSGVWTGRTSCGKLVHFVAESPRSYTGRFVNVKITKATGLALCGELVHDADFAETAAPQKYIPTFTSEVVQ